EKRLAGPGDDLPPVFGKTTRTPLPHGRSPGRGPGPLPGRRTDPGAAGSRLATRRAGGPAAAGHGRPGRVCRGPGVAVARRWVVRPDGGSARRSACRGPVSEV